MRRLAFVAFGCYTAHAAVHLARGEPYDLFWGCHIAVVLVGIGLLAGHATLNGIGLLWSCFGMPIWLLYSFTGGEFMPTALLTHAGGLVLGAIGVTRLGMPRGAWWKALAAYIALWGLTRAFTPAEANINLAFRVYPGWEQRFSSYPIYFTTLLLSGAATFVIAEQIFRRLPRVARREAHA